MSFTLKVQFTGLCLHVQHKTKPEVAVLMPDGRYQGADQLHPDDTVAVPHVGYIRLNLANVALTSNRAKQPAEQRRINVPAEERPAKNVGTSDGPFFETVYRIGRLGNPLGGGQTLDFGLKDDGTPLRTSIKLPDLDLVAPKLRLRADLFTKLAGAVRRNPLENSTPSPLLFRTVLYNGKLEPESVAENWAIERRLTQRPAEPIISPFAGEVMWTRKVRDADELVLTLTDFDGSNRVTLPLVPVDGEIRIKVANLCSENPLEWDDFLLRTAGIEDSDFKWFYQLLEPPRGKRSKAPLMTRWRELLKNKLLPAPRLVTQAPQLSGRPPFDCAGAFKEASFPDFSTWSTTAG